MTVRPANLNRIAADGLDLHEIEGLRAELHHWPQHAAERIERVLRELDAAFEELRTLGYGVASLRELTPRTKDFLLVRGEQLSARLVVAGLLARGASAEYVEAATLIRTDGVFGGAFPDLVATDREVRAQLRPLLKKRVLPVVPLIVSVEAARFDTIMLLLIEPLPVRDFTFLSVPSMLRMPLPLIVTLGEVLTPEPNADVPLAPRMTLFPITRSALVKVVERMK